MRATSENSDPRLARKDGRSPSGARPHQACGLIRRAAPAKGIHNVGRGNDVGARLNFVAMSEFQWAEPHEGARGFLLAADSQAASPRNDQMSTLVNRAARAAADHSEIVESTLVNETQRPYREHELKYGKCDVRSPQVFVPVLRHSGSAQRPDLEVTCIGTIFFGPF